MRNQIQHLVPAAALAAGIVLIFGIQEQKRVEPRAPMASIQLSVDGYAPHDTTIDANEQKIAGMDNYVLRLFQRDTADAGMSVYVGYYTYQVQGKTIHSPKNCLPGAGWEPLESTPRVVQTEKGPVTVNRYLLANKGMQALVYYWYQGRGRIEHDEYKVKWNLLVDAGRYGRTEEALVRIVVPIDPRELQRDGKATYARADAHADALAKQLVPRVEAAIPVAPGA